MKGVILDYSVQENKGVITSDNGRYYFIGSEWKSTEIPNKGDRVDFEVGEGNNALMVYPDVVTDVVNVYSTNPYSMTSIKNDSFSFLVGKAFKDYFNFKDRSRRKEYWYYSIATVIIYIVMYIMDLFVGAGIMSTLATLFLIIPSLSLSVRRLHDIDMSGWFVLLFLIPLVNLIFSICIGCIDTKPSPNKWGAPAKI